LLNDQIDKLSVSVLEKRKCWFFLFALRRIIAFVIFIRTMMLRPWLTIARQAAERPLQWTPSLYATTSSSIAANHSCWSNSAFDGVAASLPLFFARTTMIDSKSPQLNHFRSYGSASSSIQQHKRSLSSSSLAVSNEIMSRNQKPTGSGGRVAPKTTNPKGEGIEGRFVFHTKSLTKRLPTGRILFNDLNFSIYYGAKIGSIQSLLS